MKYYLDKSKINKRGEAPLFLKISLHPDKPLMLRTGITVKADAWLQNYQAIHTNNELTFELREIKEYLEDRYKIYRLKNSPNIRDLLIRDFENARSKNVEPLMVIQNFYEAFETFIYTMAIKWAPKTKKSFDNTLSVLRKFPAIFDRPLNKIENNQIFDALHLLMLREEFSQSSIRLAITHLKIFFKFKMQSGVMAHFDLSYRVKVNDKLKYVLSDNDIKTLRKKKVSNEKNTALFLLETGVRFSDLTAIAKDSYIKDDKLYFVQTKTKAVSGIPINASIKKLYKKFSPVNYYHLNTFLKTINKKASPHTLRRTFATRLYKETKDIILVQKRLGHSGPDVTAKYIQI